MTKTKRIIMTVVIILLLIATCGVFLAFFGKDDFTKVKDKWKDTFQQEEVVENRNLIYNGDFKINTTENTIFNSENVTAYNTPMVDGWHSETGLVEGATLIVSEDGIYAKISEDYASSHFLFGQNVQNIDSVFGKVVTLTFSVDDVVYSKTFNFEIVDKNYEVVSTDGLSLALCRYPSNGISNVVITLKAGFEGTINWIQLEEGSVFTGYSAGPSEYVEA